MSSRGVSTSNCYAYFLNILYLKKARSYQIFTLAFISGMSLFLHTFSVTAAESGAE